MVKVAYLGPRGTFTEQAAISYFNKNVELIPCRDLPEVFMTVSTGSSEFGVVPVENSIEGSVNIALDLLLESDLKISGEVELRIEHNLIARAPIDLSKIKAVASHPQALAQCRNFLRQNLPKAELIEVGSTAAAVKAIGENDYIAAIGTELAAKIYGMKVIVRNIEDSPNNFTRFLVLGHMDAPPTGKDKTSIIFSVVHAPGSLYEALGVFARRRINLTKIESRPTRKKPWEYIFYCDFEGHRTERLIKEALEELREKTILLKILGSYQRARC